MRSRSVLCDFLGRICPRFHQNGKEQNLSLNPSKISGVCGRLMCCLKFESQTYQDNERIFGKNCKGCVPAVVDEFYDEQENESDYYEDLLKEDSIKEVDYQMMLETAEIEKNTKQETRKPPGSAQRRSASPRVNSKRRRPKGNRIEVPRPPMKRPPKEETSEAKEA